MNEYEQALDFWNRNYENAKAEKDEANTLGCAMMERRMTELAKCGVILDYGCGEGWAACFMARAGAKEVVGVDQSQNAIALAREKARLNELEGTARFIRSDESCLERYSEAYFDGMFSSNTLDVIPLEIAVSILERASRVLKPGAPFLLTLNPYADEALREKLRLEPMGDNHYGKNGVLRCVNQTDDEWKALLSRWFTPLEIESYRFEGEPEFYTRRLFILKRR